MGENKEFCIDELTPPEKVDYFTYRLETGRWVKSARMWAIACLIVFIAFVASNIFWIWRDSQYEDIVITAEQTADGESSNYAIGGDYIGSEAKSNN